MEMQILEGWGDAEAGVFIGGLRCADGKGFYHLGGEDVAVVKGTGPGSLDNGQGNGAGQCVRHHDFQFDFRNIIRGVWPVEKAFRLSSPPSAAFNFAGDEAAHT